jgi:divalent metal cation (Fe/Co/Zn/Cd) transporter
MKSRSFIFVSLAVDLLIAVSKFVAAAITGSSSMLAEGIHSVIDAISQVLLIWGIKTSKRLPDADRPFGYGKELYFWSFIV